MYDVFLICPVRNATDEQKQKMKDYIFELESTGKTVYYPDRDTDQTDDGIGFRICADNKNAINNSKEVHIFWDKNSQGSLFDLGMAFALRKPLTLVNISGIEITSNKSFSNMVLEWNRRS
jgi:hypothetical protein